MQLPKFSKKRLSLLTQQGWTFFTIQPRSFAYSQLILSLYTERGYLPTFQHYTLASGLTLYFRYREAELPPPELDWQQLRQQSTVNIQL